MRIEQTTVSRKRRSLLACLCAIAVAFVSLSAVAFGAQPDDILSRDSVLRDPDIPSLEIQMET